MFSKHWWILMIAAALTCLPSRALGALKLEDLSSPSLQTLIGFGSTGVEVGELHYFNFGYAGSGITPPSSSLVAVQPVGENGLRFLSGFSAADGDFVGASIWFSVATIDPDSMISSIDLYTDGVAIIPGSATFASVTATARDSGGTVVGRILSTYNDGTSGPPDTTLPDRSTDVVPFDPLSFLRINQSILLKSKPFSSGGGVVTLSTIETNVVTVPEPASSTALIATISVAMFRRRAYKRA